MKQFPLVMAALAIIVAVSLMNAGCICAPRGAVLPSPTPVPATPTPAPSLIATPAPTYMPDHVDIIYTPPPEAQYNETTVTHILSGNITFNGKPAVGYGVIIDTANGCEYGNYTDANGHFYVAFREDGSPTYIVKLADPYNNLIYMDKAPRQMDHVGPMSIRLEVPSTNRISINVSQ